MKHAIALAREYRVYLEACRIVWDMSNQWFKAGTIGQHSTPEFRSVCAYLSARREECWKRFNALEAWDFGAAWDATKELDKPNV